jgi:hypothetical protein
VPGDRVHSAIVSRHLICIQSKMVMTCFSAPRLNLVLGSDDMFLGTRAESRSRSRAMEVSRHSSWVAVVGTVAP